MSLSDCEKCWSTPCECGHEYNHWDLEKLKKFYQIIGNIIASKEDKKVSINEDEPRVVITLHETNKQGATI